MASRCVATSTGALKHARYASPLSRVLIRGLATQKKPVSLFSRLDTFTDRHVGPDDKEVSYMLSQLGFESMDAFVAETVPDKIRVASASVSDQTIPSLSEGELQKRARELAQLNKSYKSYIGMGYHTAVVPPVVLRNVSRKNDRSIRKYSHLAVGYGEPGVVHSLHAIPA